jgi:tetratricopeptide (TPR) repeat protein
MAHRRPKHEVAIRALLLVLTIAAYWQIRDFDFVYYDDRLYVTENAYVQQGLNWENIKWAFTTGQASNWHPLTWLSHMLDCDLFGSDPRGPHVINLSLHIANSLLLLLVLKRMTGEFGPSALVAGLFALHPLHVESVAWVAERKDVLSTAFLLFTLWAYVRYTETSRCATYGLALTAFLAGLMSKPMLVTLPFVMVLLDYWPLGRFGKKKSLFKNLYRSVRGKSPFFILAAVSCGITLAVQQKGGAVASFEFAPLRFRVANAIVAYAGYIGKMIWPENLAVLYPHPGTGVPIWQVAMAGIFLLLVSAAALRARKRFPYLLTGWLWYLGTLVPVIGIIQVGAQSTADRYTYIPLTGIFIMIAWGLRDLSARLQARKPTVEVAAGLVLVALAVATWFQTKHWRNPLTLFERAVEVTENNYVAHGNLATILDKRGRIEEAAVHYGTAIRMNPDYADPYMGLGRILERQGKTNEAAAQYSAFLKIRPDSADGHNALGVALAKMGRLKEASHHFSEAIRISPDQAEAYANLGLALVQQGEVEEGIKCYRKALSLRPNHAETHFNLGNALVSQWKFEEALDHYSQALRIRPDYVEARKNFETLKQMMTSKAQGPDGSPRPPAP